MKPQRYWQQGLLIGGWVLSGGLGLFWLLPATAQDAPLTRAEVYRLENRVQLLPRNQTARPAQLNDVLVPRDALRTEAAAIAELLFNDRSIARVDERTTFRFEEGLRRFQLPNLVAMNETIFVLENGTALIISPPSSIGTQIRTPESIINIAASDLEVANVPLLLASRLIIPLNVPQPISDVPTLPLITQTDELLPPPERSSAAMVVHDASQGTTQVFALTSGDVTVIGLSNNETVDLLGGQTVAVAAGEVGEVQEFDLQAFYRSVPLAAGLGPEQEAIVQQQPETVQQTLNQVREATLSAVRRQERRLEGFGNTFLRDALTGRDSGFDGLRGEAGTVLINPQSVDGVFIRTGETTAVFVDAAGNQIPIDVDIDDRAILINGAQGISNDAGLSGNDATGTVIFQDGRAIRVEVFDVGGDYDNIPIGGTRPGRLSTGIAPDR